MNTTLASRCDQIIDLIDAVLAEAASTLRADGADDGSSDR